MARRRAARCFALHSRLNMAELPAQIRGALSWSVLGQLVKHGGSSAIMVVLARVLLPRDFGLVAMVAVFGGFASLFVDFGLGSAIIRAPEITNRQLSTVFWLNLSAGLAMSAVFFGASPLIAAYYKEPVLVPLAPAIGLTFTLSSLAVVHRNLLAREMAFKKLTLVESAASLTSGVVAIVMALRGYGVWSLVTQQLLNGALVTALLWFNHRFRPTLQFHFGEIRSMIGFGGNLVAFSVLNYTSRNIDNALIGRFRGEAALGLYTRAYDLVFMPVRDIMGVVSRVMFPALSRIQQDHAAVRGLWLQGIRQISFLTFPLMTLLGMVAEPLILTVFGARWAESVVVFQLLAPAAAFTSIAATVSWIYLSQGRSDLMLRWEMFSASIRVAGIVAGLPWGIRGVAAGFSASTIALAYPLFAVPGRLIGAKALEVAKAVRESLLVAAAVGAFEGALLWLLPDGLPPALLLAIGLLTGALVYAAVARGLKLQGWTDLKQLLRRTPRK